MSNLEIKGTVTKVLPIVTGNGANGEWRKQEFVIETHGEYPKLVCMSVWNDKIDEADLATGDEITAQIEIKSREYNERYYTDVKAYKIDKGVVEGSTKGDDLPF